MPEPEPEPEIRLTVRGEHLELRGHLGDPDLLEDLAEALRPFGLVIASMVPRPPARA